MRPVADHDVGTVDVLRRDKLRLVASRALHETLHRDVRVDPQLLAAEDLRAHLLRLPKIRKEEAVFLCEGIHREGTLRIRRRRNDGLRLDQRRRRAGQRIGPTQMTAQQRDHIAPRLIDHEHRRIHGLPVDKRRDRTHRDARRPHEDDGVNF